MPSFKAIAYLINKESCICVPSVKTTTYTCTGLTTSFCTKDHDKHQAISNLNQKFPKKSTLICVSFLEVLFNPLVIPKL